MQRTLKNLALVVGAGASLVVMNGCSTMTSTKTATDDKSITKNVENALEGDPVYKYPAVKVATFRGATQLSGFVDTEEQKRRATEIVRNVMGPTEVINNIVVRPSHLAPAVRDTATTSGTGTTSSSGATGTTTTTDRGTTVREDTTIK